MKYRILVSNTSDLFGWHTITNEKGETEIYEVESLEELDAQTERMLNGSYRKKDLIPCAFYNFRVYLTRA